MKKQDYTKDTIKTLDSIEHLRKRSGLYIGRLGNGSHVDDGIYVLLKEAVDNAVDEFIMGFGDVVEVKFDSKTASVRDYGRGIPLERVVDCVARINTGAKFEDNGVFAFSVGLNGVGTKAINALSSSFEVASFRDGKYLRAEFERGKLVKQEEGSTRERDGTYVAFTPDVEVFGEYAFEASFVEKRARYYAYLNRGLAVVLNGTRFESSGGLKDLVAAESRSVALYDAIYYKDDEVEFAVSHDSEYGDEYRSYVNGQYTSDGGTHLAAFKEGITRGFNAVFKKTYKADDVREGMFAAVAVKVKEPVFESQTKNKLGNADVKQWLVPRVSAAVEDFLRKNQDVLKKLEAKVEQNESLRTRLNDVRKEAREANKRVSVRVEKLKDCKKHRGDGKAITMIFVVEGDSACFVGNTGVLLADGGTTKLKDLAELYQAGPVFVIGYDGKEYGPHEVTGVTLSTRKDVVRVTFDDDSTYRCTIDHRFLTKTRGYVEAGDLVTGDVMTTYSQTTDLDNFVGNEYATRFKLVQGDQLVLKFPLPTNRAVKSLKRLTKTVTVYDVEVEDAHNFVLDNGVVVHNCGSTFFSSSHPQK